MLYCNVYILFFQICTCLDIAQLQMIFFLPFVNTVDSQLSRNHLTFIMVCNRKYLLRVESIEWKYSIMKSWINSGAAYFYTSFIIWISFFKSNIYPVVSNVNAVIILKCDFDLSKIHICHHRAETQEEEGLRRINVTQQSNQSSLSSCETSHKGESLHRTINESEATPRSRFFKYSPKIFHTSGQAANTETRLWYSSKIHRWYG